jgi:iron complex outermembrane receptor protein
VLRQFGFASPVHFRSCQPRLRKGRAAGGTRYYASITHARAAAGIAICLFSGAAFAQDVPQDSTTTETIPLDEVIISAVRADEKTPVTFSNLSKKEIAKRNLGQDIPILMNFMPSVVTTSDAGAGVGYTGIRVRGSDATRVNVTVNGIPYNDAESHGTFWVNMPDFASSVESLQLQRGVGTSTNGSGAFGASLNMLTESYSENPNGEVSNSFGSFNTRKHTVKFSSGLLNDKFEIAGRLSNIHSDGFIDRAESDLRGYFLQGTYVGKTTLMKALVFGGTEKTYQSWNGLEDPEKLRNDRTYNTAGEYVDDQGKVRFYDDETDNYQQDHYQLHWNEKWSDRWNTNLAFHYTKGRGYYENYKVGEAVEDYGLSPQIINGQEISESDIIRQKWLDNNFYGTTFSATYTGENAEFILGGGANKYQGDHFGTILWARSIILPEYNRRYYDDSSTKTDVNLFAKATYKLTQKFSLFGDIQFRNVGYRANGADTGTVNDSFNFFNPKAGLTYIINPKSNIYFSYAVANREPNRTDYEAGSPKPERLHDFELGWRYSAAKTKLNINGYYMRYKNQLVLTGALDDVGNPVRENSGDSFRTGIEIDAAIPITDKISMGPNMTVSFNKNEDFVFERDGVLRQLGDTNIAFSPSVIFGNVLTYMPIKNLQLSLLTKFVGEQYMGNIDSKASKLDSYSVTDFNFNYEIKPKSVFDAIVISGLVNNIFNLEYESNGYFYTYDDDFSNPGTVSTIEGAGYYPQAGTNFLLGLTLKF